MTENDILLKLIKERVKAAKLHPDYKEPHHDKKSICLRCTVLILEQLMRQSKKK